MVNNCKKIFDHYRSIENIIILLKSIFFMNPNQCSCYLLNKERTRMTTSLSSNISKIMDNIASLDVETCYFKSSKEAIEHSKKIGLVD